MQPSLPQPGHRSLAAPLPRGVPSSSPHPQQPPSLPAQHRPTAPSSSHVAMQHAERPVSPLRPAGMQQQQPAVAAAVPAMQQAAPVPAGDVRVPQQVLRKRDFESELLDRLLNGLVQPPPTSPAPGMLCCLAR